RNALTRHELLQAVGRNVAEDQKSVTRPGRSFSEAKAAGDLLNWLGRDRLRTERGDRKEGAGKADQQAHRPVRVSRPPRGEVPTGTTASKLPSAISSQFWSPQCTVARGSGLYRCRELSKNQVASRRVPNLRSSSSAS